MSTRVQLRLLSPFGARHATPGISISRWSGRRRRALLSGAALAIVAGTGVAAGLYTMADRAADNPEARAAMLSCAAQPSCLEWSVLAACNSPTVIDKSPRMTVRTLQVPARSAEEAASMVTTLEPHCTPQRVHDRPREISPELRARLR